jgi:hypothetical protein
MQEILMQEILMQEILMTKEILMQEIILMNLYLKLNFVSSKLTRETTLNCPVATQRDLSSIPVILLPDTWTGIDQLQLRIQHKNPLGTHLT